MIDKYYFKVITFERAAFKKQILILKTFWIISFDKIDFRASKMTSMFIFRNVLSLQ